MAELLKLNIICLHTSLSCFLNLFSSFLKLFKGKAERLCCPIAGFADVVFMRSYMPVIGKPSSRRCQQGLVVFNWMDIKALLIKVKPTFKFSATFWAALLAASSSAACKAGSNVTWGSNRGPL